MHKRSRSLVQEEILEQPFSRSKPQCERQRLRQSAHASLLGAVSMLFLLSGTLSCGGSKPAVGGSLTGNWQITLNRHASTQPQNYSGFLVQSGDAIAGSVILGGGCSGVGPVVGKMDGQNLSLTINQFGQELTLTGAVPSSSGFMSGDFSTLAG